MRRWFRTVLLAAFLSTPAAAIEQAFELNPAGWPEPPEAVHVAGTFNNWDRTAAPMTRGDDGIWRAALDLEPGVYHYKFVLDGERWIPDPVHSDPSLEEPDGHGGMNSAVLVGRDMRDLPEAKPDHILAEAIHHDPDDFHHRSVVNEELVLLGVDVRAGDAESIFVVFKESSPEGLMRTDGPRVVGMTRESTHLGLDTYVALIETNWPGGKLAYNFDVRDGDEQAILGVEGVFDLDASPPIRGFPFTVDMTPSFATPDWAKHAVWYQIFPERFRNGDPANDPGDFWYENLLPWTSDWWKAHSSHGEVRGEENFYGGAGNVWKRRYGGDLQGVKGALPYLRGLGITAIYLNPVFEAESMHKYDAADFRHIDDNFGVKSATPTNQVLGETDDPATWEFSESDRVFLDFLDEAHAQGFKVVIDGVFNHVGRRHPFFMDVLAKGKNSRYADWFEITDWGDPANWRPMDDPFTVHGKEGGIQWVAWDDTNGHLPVFKNDPDTGLAPGPRQHIFDITKRWMDPDGDGDPSDGIDGWRLDVPGDIAHPFWIEWRKLVKGINPEAYISGEIWSWAHPWLKGDQFDAVMNYQFAMPAQDFFVDRETAITPSQFAQRLNRVVYNYPMQVALAQMNLFDSHDTDRLASMFVNPDRPYDARNRLQDNGEDYDPRPPTDEERARQLQAAAFQMTFVGAPMIYYGTEAGMWSPDDPSNRMPMVWQDLGPYEGEGVAFRGDIFEQYRQRIALRNTLEVLQLGGFEVVLTDDERGILAFERRLGDEAVFVVINRSPRRHSVAVPVDDGTYVDGMRSGSTGVVWHPDRMHRPVLYVREGAAELAAEDGRVSVDLPAYGAAVLVRDGLLPSLREAEALIHDPQGGD